ncbi:MAG TPA: hypothetical protein VHJ82_04505 [Actinomycetota bacterium]|nr:hypothetical protein [Actinomycetota bacterium]
MPVVLIARWEGDVARLKAAYDRAHELIVESGGPPGELRHHCAIGDGALYVIGVWESKEILLRRFSSSEFETALASSGFPSPKEADVTILELHAIEPPL